MIKDAIRTLNWFRDLSEVEIDRLSDEEKTKLMASIKSVAFQVIFEPQINVEKLPHGISVSDGISVTGGRELWLRDIQVWFKDKFIKIMTTVNDAYKKEITEWSSDKQLFEGFAFLPYGYDKGLFPEPFLIDLIPDDIKRTELGISAAIGIQPEYKTENEKAYVRWDPEWRKKSMVKVTGGLDPKYGLLMGFLKTINGLPPDAFRLCRACKSWYFHLSKRKRKYCSEKCTKKMQARRRREKEKNGA